MQQKCSQIDFYSEFDFENIFRIRFRSELYFIPNWQNWQNEFNKNQCQNLLRLSKMQIGRFPLEKTGFDVTGMKLAKPIPNWQNTNGKTNVKTYSEFDFLFRIGKTYSEWANQCQNQCENLFRIRFLFQMGKTYSEWAKPMSKPECNDFYSKTYSELAKPMSQPRPLIE